MELMVVVLLISILAVLAVPRMAGARDDRLAFDYARQISGVIHRARTRAAARGAAHLVVIDGGGGAVVSSTGVGRVLLFELLDGIAPGNVNDPGPNPAATCDTNAFIADVTNWAPGGAPGNSARIVEGVNLNNTGIRADAAIAARAWFNGGAAPIVDQFQGKAGVIVYCVTPYGTTFASADTANFTTAANTMRASLPFAGTIEVDVARGFATSTTAAGLERRVIVASSASPRIQTR